MSFSGGKGSNPSTNNDQTTGNSSIMGVKHPTSPRKSVTITAVEDDDEEEEQDDVIPGPPPGRSHELQQEQQHRRREHSTGNSSGTVGNSSRRSTGGLMGMILRNNNNNNGNSNSNSSDSGSQRQKQQQQQGQDQQQQQQQQGDVLQLSLTDHHWAGEGILASRTDLNLPLAEFAAGCTLLQAAARGDIAQMQSLLSPPSNGGAAKKASVNVNFRDYDRRTALHVAASEGHIKVCQFLIETCQARVNRSDRWGGSPLDDAHRHQHQAVISYLRQKGATTGSGNRSTNLIKAAADGDYDEVKMLLSWHSAVNNQTGQGTTAMTKNRDRSGHGNNKHVQTSAKQSQLDVNKGDYDKRTALHLAAGEGHADICQILLEKGADPNVLDRWGRSPLDDAMDGGHPKCAKVLEQNGAIQGARKRGDGATGTTGDPGVEVAMMMDSSNKRTVNNMKIDFKELEMIDRIGSGAFGEIYKCRWRGTLVAAKIIKTAKIRRDWVKMKAMQSIKDGGDVDDAIREMDNADMSAQTDDDLSLALADFRQEISVVKSLRHPNIVLMLAYSTTERYECLISELCKCSLLDVFKAHMVHGTRMPRRTQYVYAQQLAQGMNYLHKCSPPIIHRDLKPANLLIDHSGTLKISDFGLSKIRPDPSQKESDTFTMTGETGSYRYMAPEVFLHQNYNETVDIYSFSMILFYLLVGRPPWPTIPGSEAVRRAAEEGDRPNIPRDLDARTVSLLKECWHDDPSARPPFSKILEFLHAYSKDVFHSDADNVVLAGSPLDMKEQKCSCVIL